MQREYKDQLPSTLQVLLDEIEATAGVEISVERVPGLSSEMAAKIMWGDGEPWEIKSISHGPPERDKPVTLRLTLQSRSDDLGITGALYPVPFALLCHELLHFGRFLVDRVPVVYFIRGVPPTYPDPQNPKFMMSVKGFENLLEHIVIDPRVRDYFPDVHLHHCSRVFWDSIPPKPWVSEYEIHWQLMYEWLNVQFLNEDEGVKQYAAEAMQRLGWLDEARAMADTLRAVMLGTDPVRMKEEMALAVCKGFWIPVESMGLLYGYRILKMLPEILAEAKGNRPWTF